MKHPLDPKYELTVTPSPEREAEYAEADAGLTASDYELAGFLHQLAMGSRPTDRPAPLYRLMAYRLRHPNVRSSLALLLTGRY